MSARFLLVSVLVLGAWGLIGGGGVLGTSALAGALLTGIALARSNLLRARERAPLLPALAAGVRAVFHVAHPAPPRLLLTLAGLACVALALFVALLPFARSSRAWRGVAGFTLSSAVLCGLLGVIESLERRSELLEPYAFVPDADSPEPKAYRPDPELLQAFQPGFRGHFVHPEYRGESLLINADGFRDRPWPAAGADEASGILMLGDSTLFGLGVEREETIPALLEARLEADHPGRSFRCYNAGVPGYGPRQEECLARNLLVRLQPRVCILVFYDGNDLADCRRQFVATRTAGLHAEVLPSEELLATGAFRAADFLRDSPVVAPPLWTRHYWLRYSTLFRVLDARLADTLVSLGWMPVGAAFNNGFLRALQRRPDPGIRDELELAVEAVRTLAASCRARGVSFLMVRLPAALQAEPSSLRMMLERLGQDPAQFERERPGSLVLERLEAEGMLTLDLLPELEVGEGQISPFYFREGHPNRAGNQRVAQAMARALEEATFLEESGEGLPR